MDRNSPGLGPQSLIFSNAITLLHSPPPRICMCPAPQAHSVKSRRGDLRQQEKWPPPAVGPGRRPWTGTIESDESTEATESTESI